MWPATTEAADCRSVTDCRSVIRCCQLPVSAKMDDRTTFAITDDARDRDGVMRTQYRRGPSSSTTSANFSIDSLMSTVVGRRSPRSLSVTSQSVSASSLLAESDLTTSVGVRSVSPPFCGSSRRDAVSKFSDTSRMSTERVAPGVGSFYGGELQSAESESKPEFTRRRAETLSARPMK